jgi:hypothetical protein
VPGASERIIEAALNLAWSQWTGLGVRGTAPIPSTAVDPEALIYLTAALAKHDPRLRDEALDWWSRFKHHVSRPRLSRLAARFDPDVVSQFRALEAALATMRTTSGKSRLDHLDLPARSLIRLRCIFGSNARAEILLALLTRWPRDGDGPTALALSQVGYSKRNVALVLEDLRLAGLVLGRMDGNRTHYRVANPDELRNLLGPLPETAGQWDLRVPIVTAFVRLADQLRQKDPLVQAVEARKLLQRFAGSMASLGVDRPRHRTAETYWEDVQGWLVEHLIAEGDDSSHRVPGMIEGVWLGPERTVPARKPERFSSAVLPTLATNVPRARTFRCLDLVQVATVDPPGDWAWMVLSEAGIHTYEHTIGMNRGERWRFVTWEAGGPCVFGVDLAQGLPHVQISRAYGDVASHRVRRDRLAVQLQLTRTSTTR